MTNKKWLYGIVTFSLGILLTGCGHEHTWVEATCTEPKTCSECGETEGEPLGHTWVEATCSEPKHCSVCGETEGEPLEHTLTEANYQQPATCEVCGATVGDVLPPAFEEYNVKGQFMELGKTYDYVTCCYEDKEYKTVGQAAVTNYQTFASDDTHEAKDGYEWKTVELQVVFSDENVNKYGTSISECWEDYYDIIGNDNSSVKDNNGKRTFTVNFNGQDYTECTEYSTDGFADWANNGTLTWTLNCEYLLPVGYDGAIVGLRDASIPWEDGQHIFDVANDDILFFRLN